MQKQYKKTSFYLDEILYRFYLKDTTLTRAQMQLHLRLNKVIQISWIQKTKKWKQYLKRDMLKIKNKKKKMSLNLFEYEESKERKYNIFSIVIIKKSITLIYYFI